MGSNAIGVAAGIREDLLRDLDKAITAEAEREAERALPMTREWLESICGAKDGESFLFHDVEVNEHNPGVWRVYTGRCFFVATTRGQLLDLLSGLGVGK
jgi:hypothetical protein